jgi:short-chain fatty acids transporter
LHHISDYIAKGFKALLPGPFAIAVLLTFFTFVLALFFGKTQEELFAYKILEISIYWANGLWETPLIVFAMQMMLILVLGHIIALSPPANKLINFVCNKAQNNAQATFFIAFFTILVSFFNWGLGLVFGAVSAKAMKDKAAEKKMAINYPLFAAAAYSGMMVWHGGLSGSAPLKVAEKGHFLENTIGVISLSETVFSNQNIFLSLFLLISIPVFWYFLSFKVKKEIPVKEVRKSVNLLNIKISGAEKLNHSSVFNWSFIFLFVLYLIAIIKENNGFSLSLINPNFINFLLLALSLAFHKNIFNFLKALDESIGDASGILIQFPLYFGIMGIMKNTEIAALTAQYFVSISSPDTFYFYTFLSGGIINILIPSGGGQWAIQGGIIADACNFYQLSISESIMAFAYGDQLTNMLQPFWALPLLGITKLDAKDILPFSLLVCLLGFVIFSVFILFF